MDAINKIIDGKVTNYSLEVARTGSMYLQFFDDYKDKAFDIRISNHSKIDGVDDELFEFYQNDVAINIFSKSRKDAALKFLKEHFADHKKTTAKGYFQNKVEKRVLKMKYPEAVETYLKKIKVDTTKTKKQVQQQVLEALLKMKPTGVLKKREYEKVRGMFRFKEEVEHKGIITNISTTGTMVTIKGETGKDFTIDKQIHQALLDFVKGNSDYLESQLSK